MLKIRLQRIGRKNNPSFDVVVIDSKKGPKSKNHIEKLGSYDSIRKTKSFNKERIDYWMGVGAQVSETVTNLLINENIIKGKKVNVLPKKTPIVKEKKEEKVTAEKPAETPTEAKTDASDEKPAEEPVAQQAEEVAEEKPAEPVAEQPAEEAKTETEEKAETEATTEAAEEKATEPEAEKKEE